MDDRLTVTINLSVTTADGVETVGNEVRLGLMKLEDVVKVQRAMLQTFDGLLVNQKV